MELNNLKELKQDPIDPNIKGKSWHIFFKLYPLGFKNEALILIKSALIIVSF